MSNQEKVLTQEEFMTIYGALNHQLKSQDDSIKHSPGIFALSMKLAGMAEGVELRAVENEASTESIDPNDEVENVA